MACADLSETAGLKLMKCFRPGSSPHAFGFHLAMDTLPSEELTSFFGQRGITPAFGYGPPHPSARRTSTFLNNALLSTQYARC